MSEQRDDTTERDDASRPKSKEKPERGQYYYDDATGYELYDPTDDEKEDEAEE
jgi:hypothetical protein